MSAEPLRPPGAQDDGQAGVEPGELVEAFGGAYGFPLDDFQLLAITALIEGRSVLVAAPTGAGKTVVGEFAVWQALHRGGKCFYTTPIKALSNQKYADLVRRYGADKVGLLTGDNAINGDAPVVVMTTEVLRNMLYEGSRALVGLHAVVLDEVHYLADRERGAVWEEVIIQLPLSVQLACLSATVSNAEEFGAWLRGVRESCDVVISELRPVPLEHHYFVNGKILPVFRTGSKAAGKKAEAAREERARQARGGVPNPEILMLERRAGVSNRVSRNGRPVASDVRLRPPRRADVVYELRRRTWLPAIYFLFSRQGCDDAVRQLLADRVSLTTPEERRRIREVVAERTAHLPPEDLEVLGHAEWVAGLEQGIAAHHAGMVPVFKETVEELFVANLVKVCFATETLALGINMPARTVVIERLEKWTGQRHELLTPGQFTQLTGRAGRRGLDPIGHAVVLYQRDIDFPTVASLVGRRTEPLRSSFAPSYNMAVNLLRRHTREEAEALLARSFAQYQADATVLGEEERIERNRRALAGYAENLRSDAGDFAEYWALRRELSQLESRTARERKRREADAIERALEELREGDVVAIHGARDSELAAIVGRTQSSKGVPLASAVTIERKLVRLGPREFEAPPAKLGWIRLPKSGGPRSANYRKEIANALRGLKVGPPRSFRKQVRADDEAARARIEALRTDIRRHPVHSDPALAEIEVWARRHDELRDETERLERGVRRRTGSLVRQFDRILDVLTELGYLEGSEAEPRPTEHGRRLAGIYAETDLVLAESIRRGVLDGLNAADLAAVVSAFAYETRSKDEPVFAFPNEAVRDAVRAAAEVWQDIAAREEQASLPVTRMLDPAFGEVVFRWSQGADLEDALGDAELTPGDFVRSVKQVADLLRQLRDACQGLPLSDVAHQAAKSLVRGVVAYAGV
ncbi:MAG TPA: DEAD/DEAH box helicase [Egibacteraceae bacterium]|nr:DEAD/DEAH box helicase [Egibacteraceae bacterium]